MADDPETPAFLPAPARRRVSPGWAWLAIALTLFCAWAFWRDIDFGITVSLAISAAVLGVVGSVMSVRPVPPENKLAQGLLIGVFVVLGALAVVLVVWQAVRTSNEQSRAKLEAKRDRDELKKQLADSDGARKNDRNRLEATIARLNRELSLRIDSGTEQVLGRVPPRARTVAPATTKIRNALGRFPTTYVLWSLSSDEESKLFAQELDKVLSSEWVRTVFGTAQYDGPISGVWISAGTSDFAARAARELGRQLGILGIPSRIAPTFRGPAIARETYGGVTILIGSRVDRMTQEIPPTMTGLSDSRGNRINY